MDMGNTMRLRWISPLMAGAALMAGATLDASPLAGQEGVPIEEPTPSQCICTGEMEARPWRALAVARRARLGVRLGETTEVDGRTGLRLREVPRGTPAHRAGLRDGDVLLGIDGRELGPDATATVLAHLGDVEPGDTVRVTFSRGDGPDRTASVVTERARGFYAFGPEGQLHLRALTPPRAPRLPDAPQEFHRDRVFRELSPTLVQRFRIRDGMELAAVNSELGEYFGTDRGVLVTEIEGDSPLGLRTGDVILEIGGRSVGQPRDARRILGSYREGEEIPFRIVREKRTREVTGRLP